jgi:hypothetical protein
MSWRDHLKIHPAAELFSLMSEPELRELGEDIKAKGTIHHPIVLYQGELLDGRNRLDAMEMVGSREREPLVQFGPHSGSGRAIRAEPIPIEKTAAQKEKPTKKPGHRCTPQGFGVPVWAV